MLRDLIRVTPVPSILPPSSSSSFTSPLPLEIRLVLSRERLEKAPGSILGPDISERPRDGTRVPDRRLDSSVSLSVDRAVCRTLPRHFRADDKETADALARNSVYLRPLAA